MCLTEPILPIGTQVRGHFTLRGSAAHIPRAPPTLTALPMLRPYDMRFPVYKGWVF